MRKNGNMVTSISKFPSLVYRICQLQWCERAALCANGKVSTGSSRLLEVVAVGDCILRTTLQKYDPFSEFKGNNTYNGCHKHYALKHYESNWASCLTLPPSYTHISCFKNKNLDENIWLRRKLGRTVRKCRWKNLWNLCFCNLGLALLQQMSVS